jgi:hypothetical protein
MAGEEELAEVKREIAEHKALLAKEDVSSPAWLLLKADLVEMRKEKNRLEGEALGIISCVRTLIVGEPMQASRHGLPAVGPPCIPPPRSFTLSSFAWTSFPPVSCPTASAFSPEDRASFMEEWRLSRASMRPSLCSSVAWALFLVIPCDP